jgi:hypothetical protein
MGCDAPAAILGNDSAPTMPLNTCANDLLDIRTATDISLARASSAQVPSPSVHKGCTPASYTVKRLLENSSRGSQPQRMTKVSIGHR